MIILFVQFASACEVISRLSNIYPTVNQVYELYTSILFSGLNMSYTCIGCDHEQTQIYNVLNENSLKLINVTESKYEIINLKHFLNEYLTLTAKPSINKYHYYHSNNTMEQIYSYEINSTYSCYSVLFAYLENKIIDIMDCYSTSKLFFLFSNSTIITYNNDYIYTSYPIRTKLETREQYIIYGQFFHTYSILSILQLNSSGIFNQTTFSYFTFTDFSISDTEIFILNLTTSVWKTRINNTDNFQIYQLEETFTYNQLSIQYYSVFKKQLHNNFLYIVTDKPYHNIQEYLYANQQFKLTRIFEAIQIFQLDSLIQILISDEFLIVTQGTQQNYFYKGWINLNVSLIESVRSTQLYSQNESSSFMQLNQFQNKLLQFNTNIKLYQLSIPKLKINGTQTQSYVISIIGDDMIPSQQFKFCNVTLNYTILSIEDQNIYQLYKQEYFPSMAFYGVNQTMQLNELYSGPLMNAIININGSESYDQKLQLVEIDIEQNNIIFSKIYFIQETDILLYAYLQQQLSITLCTSFKTKYYCTQEQSIQYSNITNIQFGQLYNDDNNLNNILLAFTQLNQIIIYTISYNIVDNTILMNLNSYYNYTSSSSIIQFSLLFNQLIVFNGTDFTIFSLINQYSYLINNETINDVLLNQKDIEINSINFQPQNFTTNEQEYNSIIFVNNLDSFIILYLGNANNHNYILKEFVIISITQFELTIFQLNVINNKLVVQTLNIISDLQQNNISFSLWNLDDLYYPIQYSSLPECQIYENSTIYSDNFFLYIRNSNTTWLIYNIALSYHSSLYYELNFSNDYISVTNTRYYSMISSQNNLYKLYPLNPVVFLINEPQNNTKYYVNSQYSISVYNNFSSQIQSENNITLVNTFTTIILNETQFNENNKKSLMFYNSEKYQTKQLNMTNVVLSGQILNYSIIIPETSNCMLSKQDATIINYLIPDSRNISNNIMNVSQVISINDSFIVQNRSGLYKINPLSNGTELCQYEWEFSRCLTLNYFENQLSSICSNQMNIAQYVLQFSQNLSFVQRNKLPDYFYNIEKSCILGNYVFILGSLSSFYKINQLYIYNSSKVENHIKCQNGIIDFNITYLYTKNQINETVGAIFYTCDQPTTSVKFTIFKIINQTLYIDRLNQQVYELNKYAYFPGTSFQQIMTMKVEYNQVIVLLTTNNMASFILLFSFNQFENDIDILQYQDILQTIPPYGFFYQAAKAVLQQNFLLMQFYTLDNNVSHSIYALYNIDLFTRNFYNLSYPIIMLAGYNQTLFSLSVQQFALLPQINQSQIYIMEIYPIINLQQSAETKVLNIIYSDQMYFFGKPQDSWSNCNFYLEAINSFTTQRIIMEITPPRKENLFWAYTAVGIILLICAILIIIFFRNVKDSSDFKQSNNEEYKEIEM